ncbi:MAG TPA: ester cyclase [Chloroflexota bacterium]|jgi:steroid delta-isomerase-like uncharacterized protein
MSAAENTAIVRRFLDEAISQGNLAALDELCAPDLVWHGGSVGEFRSLEQFKQGVGPFFTAFPDLRVTSGDMLAEGDKVVSRYTWHGTHRGAFFGTPATGKRVAVDGISMYRIAGGRIAEEWWQEDLLGLMRQLGAVPV